MGESGSGKSITGFSVWALSTRWRIVGGEIFKGTDLKTLPAAEIQNARQQYRDDLSGSDDDLNPVLRIETQMIEAIQTHDSSVSRTRRGSGHAMLLV